MTNYVSELVVGLGNKFWKGTDNHTNRFGDVNRVYVVNPETHEPVMQSRDNVKGHVWNFDAHGSHIVAFSSYIRPFMEVFTIPDSGEILEYTELDPREYIFSKNTQGVRRLRILSDFAVMTLVKPQELVSYNLPSLERIANLDGFTEELVAADDTHLVSSVEEGEGYILRVYELPSLEQVAQIDDFAGQDLLNINVCLTVSDLYVVATPDPKIFGRYPKKVIVYSRGDITAEKISFDLTADDCGNPEHFAALGDRMFVAYFETGKTIRYIGGESKTSQYGLVLFELDPDDPKKRIQQSPHYDIGNVTGIPGLSDSHILLRNSENTVAVLNSDDLTSRHGLYNSLELREPKLACIKKVS